MLWDNNVIWSDWHLFQRYIIRYKDSKGCERNILPSNFLACGASEIDSRLAARVIADLDRVAVTTGEHGQTRLPFLHNDHLVVAVRCFLLRQFYRILLSYRKKNLVIIDQSIFYSEPPSNLDSKKQNINIFFCLNQLPKQSVLSKSQLCFNPRLKVTKSWARMWL